MRNRIVRRWFDAAEGCELVEMELTKGRTTVFSANQLPEVFDGNGSWHSLTSSKMRTHYAQRKTKKRNGPARCQLLHRVLVGLSDSDCRVVDHIDSDGENNRPSNIRAISQIGNLHHQQPRSGRIFRGVYWSKERKKWIAQITVNNKTMNLGGFEDIASAASAYNSAAISHYGEFARLNQVSS